MHVIASLSFVFRVYPAEIKLECKPMPNVIASQPNIGGALCESSVIPFPVLSRKVWLTPAAGVPCSTLPISENARLGRNMHFAPGKIPLGGKSPRKCIYSVAAQERSNTCKVLLASCERRRCSNATKTRNPLKYAGVPQTHQQMSAVISWPKFTIL